MKTERPLTVMSSVSETSLREALDGGAGA